MQSSGGPDADSSSFDANLVVTSQLTHRKVRQEIEKELHLDAGTLDAPEYKKPLKSAITEALVRPSDVEPKMYEASQSTGAGATEEAVIVWFRWIREKCGKRRARQQATKYEERIWLETIQINGNVNICY
jgi:hypothetical protein